MHDFKCTLHPCPFASLPLLEMDATSRVVVNVSVRGCWCVTSQAAPSLAGTAPMNALIVVMCNCCEWPQSHLNHIYLVMENMHHFCSYILVGNNTRNVIETQREASCSEPCFLHEHYQSFWSHLLLWLSRHDIWGKKIHRSVVRIHWSENHSKICNEDNVLEFLAVREFKC